ncbi:hypothetical protein JW707_02895 [Candidatus Woesearchaeota archaeon]|nr:hypothetical protein [Candidatus Woesearchaeota archaeon]
MPDDNESKGDTAFDDGDIEQELTDMFQNPMPSAPVERFTAGDMRKLADKYRAGLGPEKIMALHMRLVDDNQNITLGRKRALEEALQKIGQGIHPAVAVSDEMWDYFERSHILEGQVKEIKRFTHELKSQNQGHIPQEYLQPLKEFAERLEAVGRDMNIDSIMPDSLKPMAIEKGWIKQQRPLEETQFGLTQGIELAASGAIHRIAQVFDVTPDEEWVKHKAKDDFDIMEIKGTEEEKEHYLVSRENVNLVIRNVLTSYGLHKLGLTEEQIKERLKAAFPKEQDAGQQPQSASLEEKVGQDGNAVPPSPGNMSEVLRDARKFDVSPEQPEQQTEPKTEDKTRVSIAEACKYVANSYLATKDKSGADSLSPLSPEEVNELISKFNLVKKEEGQIYVNLEEVMESCRGQDLLRLPDNLSAFEAVVHNRGGIAGQKGGAGERFNIASAIKEAKPLIEEESYKNVLDAGYISKLFLKTIEYAQKMKDYGLNSITANAQRKEIAELIELGLIKVGLKEAPPEQEPVPAYMKIPLFGPLIGSIIGWAKEKRKPAEAEPVGAVAELQEGAQSEPEPSEQVPEPQPEPATEAEEVEPAHEPQPLPPPVTSESVESQAGAETEPSEVPDQVPEPELSDAQVKAYLSEGLPPGEPESAESSEGIPLKDYVDTFDELLDQLALGRLEGKDTRESVRTDFVPSAKLYTFPAINVELDEEGNVQYHSAGKFDVEANRNLLERVLVSGMSSPVWLYLDDWCEQNGITDENSREALNHIIEKYRKMAEEAGLPQVAGTFEGKHVFSSAAADAILETFNKLAKSLKEPKQESTTIFNVVRYVNGQPVLEGEFADWAYKSLGLGPGHVEEKLKVDSVLREYADKRGVPTAAGKGIKETMLDDLLEKCMQKIPLLPAQQKEMSAEEVVAQAEQYSRTASTMLAKAEEEFTDKDAQSVYLCIVDTESKDTFTRLEPRSNDAIENARVKLNKKYVDALNEAIQEEQRTGENGYYKRLRLALGRWYDEILLLQNLGEVVRSTEVQHEIEKAMERAKDAEYKAQSAEEKAYDAVALLDETLKLMGEKDQSRQRQVRSLENMVNKYARIAEEKTADSRKKSAVIKKKDDIIYQKDRKLSKRERQLEEKAEELEKSQLTVSELKAGIAKERAKSRSYLRAIGWTAVAAGLITAATIMYGIPAFNKYINARKEADERYKNAVMEVRKATSEGAKKMEADLQEMRRIMGYEQPKKE